jgi:predicted RNase H-like nuclease (RuvC/YqgF family)
MLNYYNSFETENNSKVSSLKAEIEKLKEENKNKDQSIDKLKADKAEELQKKDKEINDLTKQMENMSQEFADMLKVCHLPSKHSTKCRKE